MRDLITGIVNLIKQIDIVDVAVFVALITLIILIITVIYIYRFSTMEMNEESEVNEMFDLKEITKQIEENPREINIDLTPYEKEQEEKAIISYDELLRSNNAMKINYKEEDKTSGVMVKKVDLDNVADKAEKSKDTKVNVISYEKEEAFLEALKKLKNMLS